MKEEILPPQKSYRESNVKRERVFVNPYELLPLLKNPSKEVSEYLKEKAEKVLIAIPFVTKKTSEEVYERTRQSQLRQGVTIKYNETVTFDTVEAVIDDEFPAQINATLWEAFRKAHPELKTYNPPMF